MGDYLMPAIFIFAGIGMCVAGIYYRQKESGYAQSAKIYGGISAIGAVIAAATAFVTFVF